MAEDGVDNLFDHKDKFKYPMKGGDSGDMSMFKLSAVKET